MESFGSRVREMRQARGWTLELLAHKCGSSKSYICQLEHKRHACPSLQMVCALADAFECSLDELAGR